MDIYQPAEDSYLLQKHVKQYSIGRVLDLGTGSGIQALTAIKSPNAKEIIAVDINEKAVNELNKQNLRKIKAIQSNLFQNVHSKFNLIIFNPPYLPQDKGIKDPALYGGKKGWEISERFFNEVSKYLLSDGVILFLFSTLTNKTKIHEMIENNLLNYEQIDQEKLHFEELFVYKITKIPLLGELESKGIEQIHYFAKGKRGVIYKGIQDKSKLIKTHFPSKKDIFHIAIKLKRKDSKAQNSINNEVNWLKILNKQGIGPKLLFSGNNYFTYKFVEGELFFDWVKTHSKKEIIELLNNILNQCYILDELRVNKEEMHHPHKHIIIRNNQPTLIDFERCSKTDSPKNTTQFIEFICRTKDELKKKNISIDPEKLKEIAKKYKENFDKAIIKNLIQ